MHFGFRMDTESGAFQDQRGKCFRYTKPREDFYGLCSQLVPVIFIFACLNVREEHATRSIVQLIVHYWDTINVL